MRRAWVLVLVTACGGMLGWGQTGWQPGQDRLGLNGQTAQNQQVRMTSPEAIQIAAGRADTVELQFAIDSGLHINSHTPRSTYLIPTALTLEPAAGVEVLEKQYPAGQEYHFSFSPQDQLSVYTGTFGVAVRVRAQRGKYSVPGSLRYQACDNRTCSSPRTLPLTLEITAH